MRKLSEEEFKEILNTRKSKERLLLKEIELFDMDVTSWDLSNIDFSLSAFHQVMNMAGVLNTL